MTEKSRPDLCNSNPDFFRKLASSFADGIEYPQKLNFTPQIETAMLAARDSVTRHIGIVNVDEDVEVDVRITLDYRTFTLTHPSGRKQIVKVDDMLAVAAELLHARVLDDMEG